MVLSQLSLTSRSPSELKATLATGPRCSTIVRTKVKENSGELLTTRARPKGSSGGVGEFMDEFPAQRSMALRIPAATSYRASSKLDQVVTGLSLVGRTLSLPNGAPLQSTGRRMMGITCASPL